MFNTHESNHFYLVTTCTSNKLKLARWRPPLRANAIISYLWKVPTVDFKHRPCELQFADVRQMFRSQKRDGMEQNDFQDSVQSWSYSFCIADEEKEPVLVRSFLFVSG